MLQRLASLTRPLWDHLVGNEQTDKKLEDNKKRHEQSVSVELA
jgi:hypothetical protein